MQDFLLQPQKKILLISFGFLLVFMLGQIIVTIIWMTRILPYFIYSSHSAKTVSFLLLFILVLSILVFLNILLRIVFFKWCMVNCKQILGYSWKVIATSVALLLFTLVEIVLSFYVSSYTIKGNYDKNNKCLKYLSEGLISASQNYNGDREKFNRWRRKFEEKIASDIKYYCDKLGIPTLVFAFLQSLSFIPVIIGFVFVIKNPESQNSTIYINGND